MASLRSYFRLEADIDAVRAALARRDGKLARLAEKRPYLRILRQPDPWECTVSYICSANNNVARIAEIVEEIAKALGRPVGLDGEVRHTFPTPEMVMKAGVEPLAELRLGLDRHSKIIAAARRIGSGKLDLSHLAQPHISYWEARRELMGCCGIGPKIADCIALFGLDKVEASRWTHG